ncbi:MAG: entericidin A/B family lipoprotein [Rhodospirillaceae bacterium]|nr:entericidin A/B family lipoprotein [Rhodospirillaceae bacterium]
MTKLRSLISALVALGVATAALSACNTMEGMGKDMKSAGKKVEDMAKKDEKKK